MKDENNHIFEPVILTIGEVAKRMSVSRSKVFEWLNEKIWTEGRHYIRNGRIVRFIWCLETIRAIQEPKCPDAEATAEESQGPIKNIQHQKSQINLEY